MRDGEHIVEAVASTSLPNRGRSRLHRYRSPLPTLDLPERPDDIVDPLLVAYGRQQVSLRPPSRRLPSAEQMVAGDKSPLENLLSHWGPPEPASLAIEGDSDEALIITPQGAVPERLALAQPVRSTRPLAPLTTVAASIMVGLLAVLFFLMSPPAADDGSKILTVSPNATVRQIAHALEARQLVRNPWLFEALARLQKADRRLKAGSYELSQGAWPWELLSELEKGHVDTVSVTVPEGLSLKEVAARLASAGVVDRQEFLRAARDKTLLERYRIAGPSAEGFLFPETYVLAKGLPARSVVEIFLDEFHERLGKMPGAESLSPEQIYERVILASIVEREGRAPEELPRIAGVFRNRIEQGMRLESCATVQYILGEPKKRLLLEDIRIPSPYNTYLNEGLPPGPIASPGEPALRAAIAPEKHDYLFFVAREDSSQRHLFSRTFTEHNRNRGR